MKFVELFAGIGGFRLGLEKQGHKCVWANEFLQKPASIYKNNFKDEPNLQDIRTIDPFSIPEHELIVGGFPCATFSIAGKRSGLSEVDTRGTLFFEICRIASSRKTPYILLENVKGLLNHDDGRTFGVILLSLDRLGYDVQWQLLNSKDFGVPQNRERIIFIGVRKDIKKEITYPKAFNYLVGSLDGCEGVINTPKDILEASHKDGIVKSYVVQLKEGESGNQYAPSGYFGLQRIKRDTPSPTICQRQGNKGACLIHWEEDRELTVPELIRLMSFPDDYYLGDKYTQKTERLGRAVPPLLMKSIANHVYQTILKN